MNLPNNNHLNVVSDGVVVEVPVQLSEEECATHPPMDIPQQVSSFLKTAGKFEELLYDACMQRDTDILKQAVSYLPLDLEHIDLEQLSREIRAPVVD